MTGRAITLRLAQRMHEAYRTPLSMREVAQRFGVGKNSVAAAFRDWGMETRPRGWNAQIAKPRQPKPTIAHGPRWQPPKSWCRQCERRVSTAEAGQCASQFCAVKHLAHQSLGLAISGRERDVANAR